MNFFGYQQDGHEFYDLHHLKKLKKTHQRKGAFKFFVVQGILGSIAFGLFVSYYQYFSVEQGEVLHYASIVSQKNAKEMHQPTSIPTNTDASSDTIRYQGRYGNIFIGKKNTQTSLYQQESVNAKKVFVNKELLEYHFLLQALYQENMIDIITKNQLSTIDLGIVGSGIMKSELISSIIKDLETIAYIAGKQELFNTSYQQALEKMESIQSLLSQQLYSELTAQLTALDTAFGETFVREGSGLVQANGIFQKDLLSTPAFVYLIDKIHTDQRKLYAPHLETMKQHLGVDPIMIKSLILSEQLRGFFTYRGLMKQIMGTNRAIMVMSQNSFGIGGMKLATAQQSETYLLENDPELFKRVFGRDYTLKSQQIEKLLTNTKDYEYNIAIISATIRSIQHKRKQSGHPINHNVGVLATLYNIGDKKPPHDNPGIGGASLSLGGDQFTFGSLSLFLYWYMHIYG